MVFLGSNDIYWVDKTNKKEKSHYFYSVLKSATGEWWCDPGVKNPPRQREELADGGEQQALSWTREKHRGIWILKGMFRNFKNGFNQVATSFYETIVFSSS